MSSKRWKRITLCCVLSVACVGAFDAVRGSKALAEDQATEGDYAMLVSEALREFKEQNWPESRALFRRAHALRPSARTLRGLGMVCYEMRDYAAATRHLTAALQSEERPLTAAQRRELAPLLNRARGFVAHYTLDIAPADASVMLDGAVAGREPDGSILVGLGEHKLEVSHADHVAQVRWLQVEGGEQQTLHIELQSKQALQLAVARASDPEPRPLEPAPDRAKQRGLRWSWVTLAASAALGAGTAVVWFRGQSKLDDLQRGCDARALDARPACQPDNVDTGEVELHQLFTNVGLAATGAMVLTTAGLMLWEWPGADERPVSYRLHPTAVSIQGRF